MTQKDDSRGSLLLLIGALVVGYGIVKLLPRLLGDWWGYLNAYMETGMDFLRPILVIGLGFLIIYAARNGGFDPSGRKLTRSKTDTRAAGVAGGLAQYFGMDSTIVRLIILIAAYLTGWWAVFILYVIAAAIIPEDRG